MNSVQRDVADVATEDQAYVEQTGISARISTALQKALLLSPRPSSPEAFAKVFSAFVCADTQLGDTATELPELPGGGEHKFDAGDARAGDTVRVRVETMVSISRARTSPPLSHPTRGTFCARVVIDRSLALQRGRGKGCERKGRWKCVCVCVPYRILLSLLPNK